MRATSKVVTLMVSVLLGAIPPFVGLDRGRAQHPTRPARSARGGILARTARYQFEVFFYATGVRVFVSDPAGAAIGASGLKGTATFYHPNSPDPWFTRPLRPAQPQPGRPAESLDLAMDLSTVPTSGATVAFEVADLPGPNERTARFTMPFAPVASGAGSPHDGRVPIPAGSYPAASEPVHYYSISGFYRTTAGLMIWVPAPGYYYGTPTQYYPHGPSPGDASDWVNAHPAPGPRPRASVSGWSGAPETIQFEPYWRPRAWGDAESYQAWLRGQMRLQHAAGRSPTVIGGQCAKCHRR
jgi:hypothetical protein